MVITQCCFGDKIEKYEMGLAEGVHVARTGERRGVCRVLVGKLEGTKPLGTTRRRWEDNIKMVLQEVGVWTGSNCLRIKTGGGHL
jgi:hypothetical protein